jgi:hypothetical protein
MFENLGEYYFGTARPDLERICWTKPGVRLDSFVANGVNTEPIFESGYFF